MSHPHKNISNEHLKLILYYAPMIRARRPAHPSFIPRSGTEHLHPTVWDWTSSSHGLGQDHPCFIPRSGTGPPTKHCTNTSAWEQTDTTTSLPSDELIKYVVYYGSEWRGTGFFSNVPLLTTTQPPRSLHNQTTYVLSLRKSRTLPKHC